jgi:crotonobetainyl-CoA:carnitine CoA-transferase CaiB-like acyl-CoA transferase
VPGPVTPRDSHRSRDSRSREFSTVDNGVAAPHWLPATPYHSSAWEASAGTRPPALGEYSRQTLAELGYSEEEALLLHERGIVTSSSYTNC